MIRVDGLTKSFGNLAALVDITLEVDSGELVLLTGPSGAGKTTLLRTLIAAERPDSGTVEIAGQDISRLRRGAIPYLRRNLGVVFQDFKLLKNRTALHNVGLALEIRGLAPREVHRRALAALAAVGLEQLADTAVPTLSGGEQQRVAIARALVSEPQIVLADEPTGNLDPAWSKDILWLLNQASRRGTTVVIATHDPTVVASADYTQCARLAGGRVVELLRRERSASEQPPAADAPKP